ncbi:hypothetical protein F5Y10DRAFT_147917 [Nemania abortiva]|nr:hypothetical protein F5Y10DRAFT_147917 [Nemania abortiva]
MAGLHLVWGRFMWYGIITSGVQGDGTEVIGFTMDVARRFDILYDNESGNSGFDWGSGRLSNPGGAGGHGSGKPREPKRVVFFFFFFGDIYQHFGLGFPTTDLRQSIKRAWWSCISSIPCSLSPRGSSVEPPSREPSDFLAAKSGFTRYS